MSRKSTGRLGDRFDFPGSAPFTPVPSRAGWPAEPSAWPADASLPVSDFMRTDVAYLRENMWVDAAVSFLAERGLRDAPVLDSEGRPVGILYVDDVKVDDSFDGDSDVEAAGFHLEEQRRLRVREVMVPYVPEITAEASIASAGRVMRDNQLDQVMVVDDDGRAVGTFSREEMLGWLVEQTGGGRALGRGDTDSRRLGEVMRPLICVRRRATLPTARDLLTAHDLEELPVMEGGQVVGVVCESDILAIVSGRNREDNGWLDELLVEDVMKPPPPVYTAEDGLGDVYHLLVGGRAGCVLIERDGRVTGMVCAADLKEDLERWSARGSRAHLTY